MGLTLSRRMRILLILVLLLGLLLFLAGGKLETCAAAKRVA